MSNERKVRERNINTNNLFLYLRNSWKIIIGGMISIAVLFSLIMWFCIWNTEANEENEIVLTEEEAAFVEEVKDLENAVKCRQDYINESILMKLDPCHKNIVMLEYRVSAEENQSIENMVANIYRKKIKLLLLDEIWKQSLEKKDIKDLEEVVKVEEAVGTYDNIVSLQITYTDLESCNIIADSLKEQINSWQTQITEGFGVHQLVLLEAKEGTYTDTELMLLQKEIYAGYVNFKNILEEKKNQMTDEQKLVFSGDELIVEKKSFDMKYIFGGILLGLVFMIGIMALIYIITDKVRFRGELEDILALCSLGEIVKKKGNDTLTVEQTEKDLADNIEKLCKKKNNPVVYLYADEKEYLSMEKIIRVLEDSQIEMRRIEKREGGTVNALVGVENVIVMETLNQSHMLKLAKFIDLCERNEVNVLGTVMVVEG